MTATLQPVEALPDFDLEAALEKEERIARIAEAYRLEWAAEGGAALWISSYDNLNAASKRRVTELANEYGANLTVEYDGAFIHRPFKSYPTYVMAMDGPFAIWQHSYDDLVLGHEDTPVPPVVQRQVIPVNAPYYQQREAVLDPKPVAWLPPDVLAPQPYAGQMLLPGFRRPSAAGHD